MEKNSKPQLKYLFQATFTNGTIFKQTSSDISATDPQKSQFYDLLQEVAKGKIIRKFALIGDNTEVSVDLVTGLFNVNGQEILLESEKVPAMPDKFELIFYRQWTRDMDVTYKIKDDLEPEVVNTVEKEPFCEYFIGWECEIAGKKYKQKLAIS